MTVNQQGRHCAHCQRTVVDFTTWSDAALYNFFSKNTAPVCGRFFSEQINHSIAIPYQPHSRLYRITIAMGLTLLFTQTSTVFAQNLAPKTEQISLLKHADTTGNQYGEINGKVLDEKKEPLISAVVQIYQNNILEGGAVSDFEGNYTIKPLEPGIYNVTVLYAGYDSLTLKDMSVPNVAVKLDFSLQRPKNQCFLGEIIRINYTKPLIDQDNPTKRTYTREEIDRMPK